MHQHFPTLLLGLLVGVLIQGASPVLGQDDGGRRPTPTVVENLDLERYAGRWFEIARIPNRFQNKCASNATAEYRLLEDGRIEVINRCVEKDGDSMEVEGVAKRASEQRAARLEVSFVKLLGKQLFWGDYWVIGLGEDYEYSIVGDPERKYGWILARTPRLDDETLRVIHETLTEQGYDADRFEMTLQEWDEES